jgi:iron-sulfur cluster assembly accessory protein
MNVTITPAAEKFIRRMMRFGGGPDSGFRLTVSSGGCSGLAAEFSVEPEPRQGDAVVALSGMKFFLPAESRLLLEGVTIDFVDTPMQTGFVFHDPKGASCGCKSEEKPAIEATGLGLRH